MKTRLLTSQLGCMGSPESMTFFNTFCSNYFCRHEMKLPKWTTKSSDDCHHKFELHMQNAIGTSSKPNVKPDYWVWEKDSNGTPKGTAGYVGMPSKTSLLHQHNLSSQDFPGLSYKPNSLEPTNICPYYFHCHQKCAFHFQVRVLWLRLHQTLRYCPLASFCLF